jgi:hypothetical protein
MRKWALIGAFGLIGLGIALVVAAAVIAIHPTLPSPGLEYCQAMQGTRHLCPEPGPDHHVGLALAMGGAGVVLGLLGSGLLARESLKRARSRSA